MPIWAKNWKRKTIQVLMRLFQRNMQWREAVIRRRLFIMTIFFRGLKSSRFRFLTKKKVRPKRGWQNIKCQFLKKRPSSFVKDWELLQIHSLPEFLES